MGLMNQQDWDEFENAVNEFHEDAFQQEITWKRLYSSLSEHGEDNHEGSEDLIIKGLFLYNYFRSWPTNKAEVSGEIDKESCLLYLNIKYLKDNNYTNADDQFQFNPVMDRFIVNGIIYKSTGDSQAAQSNNGPLLHFLILKREEISSGKDKY